MRERIRSPSRSSGRDRAAGPQPDQREPGFLLFFRAGPQVDVHERVELVDDDVNVVGSDACRQHGHALARIISGGGHEFAVRCPVLDSVEPGGDLLDPSGVSDQYDGPSQLLGAQVQMKDRTVGVDDQFGRGYRSCHVFYGVSDRFRIVPAGRLSLFSRSAVSMRVRTTDRLRRCGSACGVVSFFSDRFPVLGHRNDRFARAGSLRLGSLSLSCGRASQGVSKIS